MSSDDERLIQLVTLHDCDLVIDIGANVGQYGRRIREAGWNGPIVSVEPASAPHAELLQTSDHDSAWTVAPRMALGDVDGDAKLHINARSDMNSLSPATPDMDKVFPKAVEAGAEQVRVRRLDTSWAEIANDARRVFAKIDAQGYEFQVLKGAKGKLQFVAGLQLELPIARLYERDHHYLDTLNRLRELGYELHFLFDPYFSRTLGRQVKIDGVFFRDER